MREHRVGTREEWRAARGGAARAREDRIMSFDTPRAKNLALLLLAMTQFVLVIDAAIVNVALPSIGHALRFSQVDLSWVVNAYTLTFGGFLLLGGRLADLFGRRDAVPPDPTSRGAPEPCPRSAATSPTPLTRQGVRRLRGPRRCRCM
jgi:hypothetical protein